MDDKSSSTAACTTNSKCFLQYRSFKDVRKSLINFDGNFAAMKGSNIYGWMLNRCVQNPYFDMNHHHPYNGFIYMKLISNIASNLNSISSGPIQVCICNSQGSPDCNYQPPILHMKKGEINLQRATSCS